MTNITDISVCELMYLMRDAVLANKLGVAIYLSREIHNKLSQMVLDKESVQCKLDCGMED